MSEELIRATVQRRDGKHYGTDVVVNAFGKARTINVWMAMGEPSDDELDYQGVTRSQWDYNESVEDGWGVVGPCQEVDLIDWSHYQSRIEKWVADTIAAALDGQVPPADCLAS